MNYVIKSASMKRKNLHLWSESTNDNIWSALCLFLEDVTSVELKVEILQYFFLKQLNKNSAVLSPVVAPWHHALRVIVQSSSLNFWYLKNGPTCCSGVCVGPPSPLVLFVFLHEPKNYCNIKIKTCGWGRTIAFHVFQHIPFEMYAVIEESREVKIGFLEVSQNLTLCSLPAVLFFLPCLFFFSCVC